MIIVVVVVGGWLIDDDGLIDGYLLAALYVTCRELVTPHFREGKEHNNKTRKIKKCP